MAKHVDVRDIARDVADIWPDYRPTQLVELPAVGRLARVERVLAKLECERPLGNFKALGGMVAALRALARVAGVSSLRDLCRGQPLPGLVCASAGNHGLAVAAAAQWAGTSATVYLAEGANPARAARIEELGARVVWTAGTYDDAVLQAAKADGLVIADTSVEPEDPVVLDVMDGYGLIARELVAQLAEDSAERRTHMERPTHLFVQAGVGGLAAALTAHAQSFMRSPQRVLVVEPQSAACVAAALVAGEPVRVEGELSTSAEMLACGRASARAVQILRDHGARSVVVSEELLQQAASSGELQTTPSGATGLAGLLQVSSREELRERHQLEEESCVLLVITEGAAPNAATIFGTSRI